MCMRMKIVNVCVSVCVCYDRRITVRITTVYFKPPRPPQQIKGPMQCKCMLTDGLSPKLLKRDSRGTCTHPYTVVPDILTTGQEPR